MIEEWKKINEYEDKYEISNLGRVKSLCRYSENNKLIQEKYLKITKDKYGYAQVTLYKNSIGTATKIHKLIATHFMGHIPDGFKYVINHIDGNKYNSTILNLEIVTQRYNVSDGKQKLKKTSKYTGVSWNKKCNKWLAQIQINGKKKNLGIYINEEDAYNAYQNKLKEINNND